VYWPTVWSMGTRSNAMTPTSNDVPDLQEKRTDKGYAGQVVYLYAYDVAYDMVRKPIPELLGQLAAQFVAGFRKRGPKDLFFYRPQMFHLPTLERTGPSGKVMVRRTVKLFPVGAISIAVYVPFQAGRLEDLVAYHDVALDGAPLEDEVRMLAETIRTELLPYSIRPAPHVRNEEAYTVFCIHETKGGPDGAAQPSAEAWLNANRRAVAALLSQEPQPRSLSLDEARQSTSLHLSYYDRDLSVIDWDAALLIDAPENFDETLHIVELANVQLTELEAYDRILDDAAERAYPDLRKAGWRPRSSVQPGLREIHVDLARLSDELFNITKFFGDWYLARLYQDLSARFHLDDWKGVIDEKLSTLAELYQILKQDQTNSLMMGLEILIVLLFVIDLVILVLGMK
jgi:hypothetical protein